MMENWEKELEKYINSKEHKYTCIAYSEGQECCLEKKWIRRFIEKIIKEGGMKIRNGLTRDFK